MCTIVDSLVSTEVEKESVQQSMGLGISKPKDRRTGQFGGKLSKCLLILIMLLTVCIMREEMAGSASKMTSTRYKTINRISYGVVFEFNQEIMLKADSWTHLFVVNLPKKIFKEEQLFLKSLHEGSSPTLAFCGKQRGASQFYSPKQLLTMCNRFDAHIKFLLSTAARGYENLHFL